MKFSGYHHKYNSYRFFARFIHTSMICIYIILITGSCGRSTKSGSGINNPLLTNTYVVAGLSFPHIVKSALNTLYFHASIITRHSIR